jgi:O-antigen ligase
MPLVFYRGFAEQFSYLKILVTKLTVLVGLVAWALALLWGRSVWSLRSRLALPLVLLSLAVIVSCLNSPVPVFSLREAAYFLCGPAWALLFIAWADGEAMVRRAARLAAMAATVVALIGVLQWSGHDPLLWGGYRIEWGHMVARMRLYSTLGNPNFVAGYLIGAVFLALALAAVAVKLRERIAWSAAAAVMLVAIVGTGSRGAWGGLGVGALVAGLLIIIRGRLSAFGRATAPEAAVADSRPKGKRRGQVRSFIGPVSFWFFLPVLTRFIEAVLGRFEGRLYLWRVSWPVFAEHPLIGSGWGSFQLRFLDLQARFIAEHPALARYWSNVGQLHNDPMQLWLETGAVGLVAFGWVVWRYGWETTEGVRVAGSGLARFWLAASAGGVAAILFDSIFNFQFSVPPTLLLLFTLLALPVALGCGKSNEGGSVAATGAQDDSIPKSARSGTYLLPGRILLSLVLLVSAGLLIRQIIRPAQAERDYAVALGFERAGDFMGAEQACRHGLTLDPLNGRLHFGLARVLFSTDQPAEALAETLRAERTYRDSHIEVLKARILDQMGAASPALQTYRHALALDPTLKTVQADIQRLEESSRAQ